MNNNDDIPLLERPSFFQNQRLAANDLSAAQTYNRALRWLHNRSLHGWGIAFGFAVSGPRGAQSVKVQAGYAVDCIGRDLVLDNALEKRIPAIASDSNGSPATYYLTISYAEDADLPAVMRAGECKTSGAVRRPEMPTVRWQDPNDSNPDSRYRQGFDVVLGAIRVLNCQLAEDVSGRERRDAVPPQQPYVAAGRTEAGNTTWQLWPNDKAPLGLATTVPTAGAGFQTTPRYQAHVVGERMFQSTPGSGIVVVDGFAQIAQVTASSFELRVILPTGTTVGDSQSDIFNVDDYKAVAKRLNGGGQFTFQPPTLRVGGDVFIFLFLGGLVSLDATLFRQGPLKLEEFVEPLNNIAKRNNVSLEKLLHANGWTPETVSVTLGQTLALPGDEALKLNPNEVLKPEFMDQLKHTLGWHVVWTGVEG